MQATPPHPFFVSRKTVFSAFSLLFFSSSSIFLLLPSPPLPTLFLLLAFFFSSSSPFAIKLHHRRLPARRHAWGGGVKILPVQAGGVVLGPPCFQLLLLRGTHSLRVCGGKEKGLPAHGEISLFFFVFFLSKATKSNTWGKEIWQSSLTCASEGGMINT